MPSFHPALELLKTGEGNFWLGAVVAFASPIWESRTSRETKGAH
jgi:hypothetical protein